MVRNHLFHFLLVSVFMLCSTLCFAQAADPIVHLWYNSEGTAKIQIFKADDGKFYGKIVWLKVPLVDVKPKVDGNNPNKSRRNDPLNGLMILRGFTKHGDHTYEDGTVYDPKNGKTYSCTINHQGNTLEVRGYVGISLFGRTAKWTLAE